jgi:menaquinone-dependent protoporphyrinogen oxidase
VDHNVAAVALPEADPVHGTEGPLVRQWAAAHARAEQSAAGPAREPDSPSPEPSAADRVERTVSRSILLAYATKYGSTQAVAEQIATTLREKGLQVSVQRAREVGSLEGYDAVILGAALYMFRWHRDARRFLKRHRQALADRPVAVFALGPVNDDEGEFQDARAQLDKQLARFPWFAPAAIEVFGGVWDPSTLGFPFSVIPALKKIAASDARDWDAIRAWAAGLGERL